MDSVNNTINEQLIESGGGSVEVNEVEGEGEGYQFIRSPSKRKFFQKINSIEQTATESIIPITTIEMENLKNEIGNLQFTNHKEQIKKHQDSPQEQNTPEEALQSKYVPNDLDESNNFVNNPVYAPTTTPVYTQLQFSSIQKIFDDVESGKNSGEEQKQKQILFPPKEDDTLQESLLAVFFSSFYLIFTIGIFYSYYSEGNRYAAGLTLLIITISSGVLQVCYLFNRKLKKVQVWKTSKIFTLITFIPGILSLILSFADLTFALKERNSRIYTRPWINTKPIYLVESIFLAFPQCVLQSILLLEDINSIPSVKGFLTLIGCFILILGITFARVRYDSDPRSDRFGSGIEKIIRCTIIFGNKGLWVITYVCLAVSIRLRYPDDHIFTTLIALVAITLLYEIPVLLPALQCCHRCVAKTSGMFFFIPQFTSLLVIMLWINTDLNIYITNVGVCALGSYTLFESLALMGWLLDSCSDREMDILPIYPHIFGDLYGSQNSK